MDIEQQKTVYTHFIQPFLSRKDLSDPSCISSVNGSQLWLQANFGNFSKFATIQELQALNPNFSSAQVLSELAPSQVAELLLSSNVSNDTELIDRIYDRLEVGNTLENVDEFLTQLAANEQVPKFQPVVRDLMMNRTFVIISTHFINFTTEEFHLWFNVKLVPILAGFTPEMLQIATSSINCTNYHVIVSGLDKVFSDIPQDRQQSLA
ncbi:uncharacterized protein LOC106512231, partial [Austrofundulus limnaeus]|uniref:Uncharacterized protein LOC106512231 n=1 Tax=Austrofundulus limnaeus TaxID=52670 RepID=A0A2I4ALH8_AUSLI